MDILKKYVKFISLSDGHAYNDLNLFQNLITLNLLLNGIIHLPVLELFIL